jgi:hypothetical protein
VGNFRVIHEQKRETPEWIESVIPARPMMRLEHCQIATLAELGYYLGITGVEEKLTRE